MITVNEKFDIDIPDLNLLNTPKEELLFFDIETTGFSARSTSIYLIGVIYFMDDSWNMIQWFAEDIQSEAIVLASFFEFAQRFRTLVHYNGEGFDIPYMKAKCLKYNLPYTFEGFESFDIFKHTKKIQKLLKLENYKQKTIEKFLEIQRNDKYTGGELINVYNRYLQIKEPELLDLLLQHNREDLSGMTALLPILSYCPVTEGRFRISSIETVLAAEFDGTESTETILTAVLDTPVPKRVSFGNDTFYLTAYNSSVKLRVKVYTGELKYFYSNYKDYYYLPDEDTSIHKSIAFYVDKNYRTKAKAANCYSKKTGMFIPQSDEIVIPYFKINYNDKITYFELEESFIENTELQKSYFVHVISQLL